MMDTKPSPRPDLDADLLPDQVEMLYKTQFNQAWGTTPRHDSGNKEWALRQIDSAHQRAAAEVEKHYVKTRSGNWMRKLQWEIGYI